MKSRRQPLPRPSFGETKAAILNRTNLHEALSATFDDWIANLPHDHVALRENVRKRMDQIITIHYK
jgi:hypothetical protein